MSQFQEISRSLLVDGNDDSPYYDSCSTSCGCQVTSDRTCSTSRCLNYATLTECLKCSSECQNHKFQSGYSSKLEVRECGHKGNGLFCLEDLKKGQFVKEYVGEIVSEKELQKRLKASQSIPHLYVMELKTGSYLDARHKGSISRYINHSCEPNCTVEVWTVGRKLRAGIFTLKSIPADTELTFDYRWERSTRPPTKCYCGTISCRGYLEVDESDDEEGEEENEGIYEEKTGRWVTNHEAYQAALESMKIKKIKETQQEKNEGNNEKSGFEGGEWLINKRIKIWWEGNQRYFDADVRSYESSTGIHTIQYLVDGQISKEILCLNQQQAQERYSPWKCMSEENLFSIVKNDDEIMRENSEIHERKEIDSPSHPKKEEKDQIVDAESEEPIIKQIVVKKGVNEWQWLNEEKSDYVIRKKNDIEREVDDTEEETKEPPMPLSVSGESWKPPPAGTSPHIKLPTTISPSICRKVLEIVEKESTDPLAFPQPYTHITEAGIIRLFREVLKSKYETFVRGLLKVNHSKNEFEGKEEESEVALYGRRANVEVVHHLILRASDLVRSEQTSSRTSLYSSLVRSQPSILTIDWRRRISSDSLHLLTILSYTMGIVTPITDLHISSLTQLSLVPYATTARQHPAATAAVVTDDPVLKTTRTSMINLCKTVNISLRVEFHALVLLQRCFDILPSSFIGSDILSLLCSCLLISMKMNSVFKPKHIPILIAEGYLLIFQRKLTTENDQSSIRFYRDRVLEMEKKLFKTLYCDIFIPDITYLPLYSVSVSPGSSLHRDKEVDAIKEMILLLSTYLYRIGSKSIEIITPNVQNAFPSAPPPRLQQSILCHEGLKLFPVDLLQWSMGLMGCILHSFLQLYETLSSPHSTPPPAINNYLPLREDLFHHALHMMVDSATLTLSPRSPQSPSISLELFHFFYANALQYYNSLGNVPRKVNSSPTTLFSQTPSHGPESVLWGVSVVSYITQLILSSSEIRTLSETLSASLPSRTLPSSSSISTPLGKKSKHSRHGASSGTNNSLFGTPTQWKNLVAMIPVIYVKWAEKIELSGFVPSNPSSEKSQRLKSKCVTVGELNDDLSLSSSHHSSDDQIGWLDQDHVQIEYIDDRRPIATSASTSHSSGNKRKDRESEKEKEKGDEDASSPVYSSSGIVYGHYSPKVLKQVNIYSSFQSNPTSTSSLMALIPLPAIKTQLREIKKYIQPPPSSTPSPSHSKHANLNYGLSPLSLSELVMSQYLHYFEPLSPSLASEGIECPMAVAYDPHTLHKIYANLYYNHLAAAPSETPHQQPQVITELISTSPPVISRAVSPDPPPPSTATETDHDPDSVLSLLSSHRTQKPKESQNLPPPGAIIGSGQMNGALLTPSSKPQRLPSSSPSSLPTSSFQSPLVSLYFLSPATLSHFPLSALLPYTSISTLFSPYFLKEMARDILNAISYCHSKGIVFRYISHDSLFLSTSGRVVLQSLQGAVYLYQEYSSSSRETSHSKRTSNQSTSASSSAGPYLAVSAPEVILGAHPTESSSVWSAVSVCYSLFFGIPPVKSSTTDPKKYLQHLFALLGTPGNIPTDTTLINYYSSLPFAQDYGLRMIDRQTQQETEARSRLEKVIQKCPSHILESFASNSTSVFSDTSHPTNSLIEVFLGALQLNPFSRPSFNELLKMPFFSSSEHLSSSQLLQIGKILSHLRSKDKDLDLETARASESNSREEIERVEEKIKKREELDDDLMKEVYGKNWKLEYKLLRDRDLEEEKEKMEKEKIEREKREEEERVKQIELEEKDKEIKKRKLEETRGVRVSGQEGKHFKPRVLSQLPSQRNPPKSQYTQDNREDTSNPTPRGVEREEKTGGNWGGKGERQREQTPAQGHGHAPVTQAGTQSVLGTDDDWDESRLHYLNHPSYHPSGPHSVPPPHSNSSSTHHRPHHHHHHHHSAHHSRERVRDHHDDHYRHRSRSRERTDRYHHSHR